MTSSRTGPEDPLVWHPYRKRLSDQVAEQLKHRILTGLYPPRSQLPPERLLAEELGVTRLTLREALKSTEAAGFTRTRHGDGTYTCDLEHSGTLQLLGEILTHGRPLSSDEILSLLEFREVVGLGFASGIASKVRPEHVDQLDDIVRTERSRIDDLEALLELDFLFHEKLAEASGNLIYVLLVRSVRAAYLDLSRKVFAAVGRWSLIVDAHEQIARTVRSRDAAAITEAITGFVRAGNEILRRSLEAKPPHDAAVEGAGPPPPVEPARARVPKDRPAPRGGPPERPARRALGRRKAPEKSLS
jgi:DNA-binding FadR family transcriptional regulator